MKNNKKILCLLLTLLLTFVGFAFAEENVASDSVTAGLAVVAPNNYLELEPDPYAVLTPQPEGYEPPTLKEGQAGTVTVFPPDTATLNLTTNILSFNYTHGWDSTHKLVLQFIYPDEEGNELLLGQSGILEIGSKLDRMDALATLPVGEYDCQLALFFFTGEHNYASMSTRVAVKLTVVQGSAAVEDSEASDGVQ